VEIEAEAEGWYDDVYFFSDTFDSGFDSEDSFSSSSFGVSSDEVSPFAVSAF
jgi:hypothetical protein